MSKTFGVLTWHPAKSIQFATWPRRKNDHPVWAINALPHVTMRAKRIFSRVETSSNATLYLTDGIGIAHEIEWFCQMYPLEMDRDTAALLAQGAAAHRERQQAIDDILGGSLGRRADLSLVPGMTPRDYQSQFVDLLAQVQRVMLGDATGVGKTITSALGFALPDALPALIVVPTNLPPQTVARMTQLWPMLTSHVLRGTKPYDFADVRALKGHQPDILIAPYSRLAGWRYALAGQVRSVVFDEVQNLRSGRTTEKGKAAGHLSDMATYVTGQSATPAHNYGTEFFEVLDIIKPGALGTRAEFLREWGGASYGNHETIREPKAFGTYLREAGLMLARTRKDVGRQIPEPVVEIITVDSNSKAFAEVSADIADIAARIVDDATTNKDRFLLGGELDWKMRQATGVAKAPYVAQHVIDLLENGEDKVLLVGWHRSCFEAGTRALMYDGSTRAVEDVAVGDVVMGPDSTPRTVQSLVRGRGRMFRIVPNKGEPWVCSEHHLLTLWNGRTRSYIKISAGDFAAKSPRWQREHTIYRAEAVTFGDAPSVLEPWLVGYWLGDGAADLRDLRVVTDDDEVDDEIARIAARHGVGVNRWASKGAAGDSTARQLCFSSGLKGSKGHALLRHFRSLGLHKAKRVPPTYLAAPVEDRLELLAGLIDSDGHVYRGNGVGSASYASISGDLARDVARLARSLGMSANVSEKRRREGGYPGGADTYFSVNISGDLTRVPVRISRKRAGQRAGQKNVLRTGFRIEEAPVDDFFGFEVDGDHLFLLDDFTVVHNCYDLWLNALRRYRPVMYTGSESVKQKNDAVQEFLRPTAEGGSRVLIMSHASGAGLDDLQKACSVVVFGELDWSPKVHSQIVDRLNRDGQESVVLVQYLVVEDGSDPKVIEVLGLKAGNTDPVMDPDVALFEPVAVAKTSDGDDAPKGRMRDLAQSWLDRHPSPPSKKAA